MEIGDKVETINGIGRIADVRYQGGMVIVMVRIGSYLETFTSDEIVLEENQSIESEETDS